MAVDQKKMQGQHSSHTDPSFDMHHGFPVDNQTYNLMQAMVSKCEAIEAYRKYAKDPGGEFFNELIQREWKEAEDIMGRLRGCFVR